MFFILVLTVSDIRVHSRSTSVYLAGIYCHQIISIWNALPHSDSGVTAPTFSNFHSCVRSIDISVFAVFNHFVLGHMLEVVFSTLCVLFGAVYCSTVFTLLLYLFRIKLSYQHQQQQQQQQQCFHTRNSAY